MVLIDSSGCRHSAHSAMLRLKFPVFRSMSKADGFDTTLATVILDGVNTDEAKLLIEIAYSMDRSIKENNFLLKNATIFVKTDLE